ncbi:hypothetical protein [Nocardia pneumoniae]|uniref:hypothetical protein n=1 Tax=Nocardia pneumoniae TaxID=228601 RepID=UPI0005929DC5|nr:hypothetical protein [Nocardia pneumoniae]
MAQPEQLVSRTNEPGVVARIADDVHRPCRGADSAAAADYIPALTVVQADSLGVCPATADGRVRGARPATKERAISAASTEHALGVTTRLRHVRRCSPPRPSRRSRAVRVVAARGGDYPSATSTARSNAGCSNRHRSSRSIP